MPYKYRRDCPVCNKPGILYLSDHLRQVHNVHDDERKKWLARATFSTPYNHNPSVRPTRPARVMKEVKCARKKAHPYPVLKSPKTPKVTASLNTYPYREFNFRHKFSLLVVGPSQSGKTYFVQQILENDRIVFEENKRVRIFWYYNQWQDRYNVLKQSLGKTIAFERGLPDLSDDLSEISTKYNNIIVLDDLVSEKAQTVSWLFGYSPKVTIETLV